MKQTVDPLHHWDCVLEWSCRASTALPPPPSNLTGALTVHCVARRRRTCKEQNRTGEGMWYVIHRLFTSSSRSLVKHPLKADETNRQLFRLSAWSLVKRPMKGDKVSEWKSCWGHQCSETSLTGEPGSIVCVGAYPGREPLPPRQEANGWPTGPVRLCIRGKLQGLHKNEINFS
jgi:hypothetical protein